MNENERRMIAELTTLSGLPPLIVDFAVFVGFRHRSDQTVIEQVQKLVLSHDLSCAEARDMLGECFRDEVTDFYATKFPVVRR